MMMYFWVSLLLVSLFGCKKVGEEHGPGTHHQQLNVQRELWQNRGIKHYALSHQVFCFCPGPTKIKTIVENDIILSVLSREESRSQPKALTGYRVSDLFNIVQSAIDEDFDVVKVEYDEQYGFPVYIELDPATEVADDEFTLRVERIELSYPDIFAPRS